ncbi:putative OsmC-like protein [Rhizobium sp. SG_E_25_P2]|uniref:OsmC family protein n=1 Tax=Rhizobium sp. SG_E_25_P2 TaxID=2879942 RepID=UPI00247613D7|nr:OsmC family protein [Rhizobium sp. SG_E_25_P2]MDH6268581.1 putative OsmC-like protein [Rhizobium sp. SG_E_25_P2]
MLEYRIAARRIDGEASVANAKMAEVRLDTGLAGSPDAFNPAELLLAAIAACMIKGIERVAPMLDFSFSGVEVSLHAIRQDAPPKIVSVDYELVIDTVESDQRLELLHKNVRKYGTISNTVAAAARLDGVIRRKS